MNNLRKHGIAPFSVAVIHGGPGAPGTLAPVARELSREWGVLEPLQTATSVEGQVQELRDVLEKNGDLPVTLIGWSWGAWLSFIFAARYPSMIGKLILVGSGPFEEKYAAAIMETRLSRLSEDERSQLAQLESKLNDPAIKDKNTLLSSFGRLFDKTDSCAPLDAEPEEIDVQFDVYQRVWQEAAELRRTGELLAYGRQIQCRVVAIHGDYDPHPPDGVERPLSRVLRDLRFILLKSCGHRPWIEREARDRFYEILRSELCSLARGY